MDLQLHGKKALITGSTRGIGMAVARALLQEGAEVAINGTNEGRLETALAELSRPDAVVRGKCADIASPEDVRALFRFMEEEMGGLDILINNAGIYRTAMPFLDIQESDYEETMSVNFKSLLFCGQAGAALMRRQGRGGVILNASSYAALIPSAGSSLYAASKAAISNLTRAMAGELAPYGIRVNAYIPGVIATDMNSGAIASNREGLLSQISLGRFGEPEEVAAPLVFLASSQASYITGCILEVTGGKLAVQQPAAAWQMADGSTG
ncbi:SDR family NAD(P)-dependent oxidoreductase [Paenibacillus koleovorans]|uniref:SDR family NAD(P)-dependent oxidoreductase n=1 Tax=Paenibacillus koleovorans TaxID=121608 RepID=UPI000FD918F1|nr:SDR family oxidoreductase [Paenibacillus koleovorans]